MKNVRGFALGVFLLLLPVLTIMAWTFLKVAGGCRIEAVTAERRVRGLQAAEAGIRSYLSTGQPIKFELNECDVTVQVYDGRLVSTAEIQRSQEAVAVILEIEAGYVTRRRTNEANL